MTESTPKRPSIATGTHDDPDDYPVDIAFDIKLGIDRGGNAASRLTCLARRLHNDCDYARASNAARCRDIARDIEEGAAFFNRAAAYLYCYAAHLQGKSVTDDETWTDALERTLGDMAKDYEKAIKVINDVAEQLDDSNSEADQALLKDMAETGPADTGWPEYARKLLGEEL